MDPSDPSHDPAWVPPHERRRPSPEQQARAAAWLKARDAGRFDPPKDRRSRDGWNAYWVARLEFDDIQQAFADMVASDPTLVGFMRRRDVHTVLCAGNGLSTEALVLALHGFQVTAMDIADVPGLAICESLRDPEHRLHQFPGFAVTDTGFRLDPAAVIAPELLGAMHRSNDSPPRGGGSLSFVVADLLDADACPGPYDAVIERLTVQLLPPADQALAIDRLVNRLADRGLLVSQVHNGGWRPGEARSHYAEAALDARSFVRLSHLNETGCVIAPRVASLVYTSG